MLCVVLLLLPILALSNIKYNVNDPIMRYATKISPYENPTETYKYFLSSRILHL